MFQKKVVGTRWLVFLAASPLVTALPSNLTSLYYNGSAVGAPNENIVQNHLNIELSNVF